MIKLHVEPNLNYEIILYWRDANSAFVAEVPELLRCLAHSDTQKAIFRNVNQATELWIDTARAFGDPIRNPRASG